MERIEITAAAPLVSCIMPTYNRRAFVPHAIRYFLRQTYPQKELIIIDDGTDKISDLVPVHEQIRYYALDKKLTLGTKLNLACQYARGTIIANWDDDDWYAEWRLTYQVQALHQSGTAVCGINRLLYYNIASSKGYVYIYPPHQRVWLLGSSLCFKKELWNTNSFADINVGMDGLFVWATAPERVKVLEDYRFSVHMIHEHNISPKNTNGGYWHSWPVEDLQQIMDADWNCYINDGFFDNEKASPKNATVKMEVKEAEYRLLKNVYACLVHENEDCIIDLVRNLDYLDPDSTIVLYNGNANPKLLSRQSYYERYGVLIHPRPVPQQHGRLHKFALDCMAFACDSLAFDTLTIVDSDQLSLRPGYSQYLGRFLSTASNVGMLSNKPQAVLPNDTINVVATQAFREIELWKPFLKRFANWESKFVHWTYWPATVFTANAVRDLLKLFRESDELNRIMQQTKIWATEEVIFPTLVSLLNYEIAANPTSHDFIKYRKEYSIEEIDQALNKLDAYWIHPVPRNSDDNTRSYIRKHFNDYVVPGQVVPSITDADLVKKIAPLEGWLDDCEAELLIDCTRRICEEPGGTKNIVEIGSYHGKATIIFGSLLKERIGSSKVFAIDTHDGKLGAADQGLKYYPPSYDSFIRNIGKAAVATVVEPILSKAVDVIWNLPVSILFIDGLHDYENVCADFRHFEKWIKPGGYAAFHDYADYYPGVKRFVNELLATGEFTPVQQVHSLIVVRKQAPIAKS